MIDERCEIWNILHDGWIEKVEPVGGDLKVRVSISYLAGLALPGSEYLLLNLHECRSFKFEDWDSGAVTTEPRAFEELQLTILSTEGESLPAQIVTTRGYLLVDCTALSMELEDGSPLSFQRLCEISEDYWDRFTRRTQP